jgi:hypothetical protein
LNQFELCSAMVSSYAGGFFEVSVHCLTVLSREAEKRVEKIGKVTTRTLVAYRQLPLHTKEVYCELDGDKQVVREGGAANKGV